MLQGINCSGWAVAVPAAAVTTLPRGSILGSRRMGALLLPCPVSSLWPRPREGGWVCSWCPSDRPVSFVNRGALAMHLDPYQLFFISIPVGSLLKRWWHPSHGWQLLKQDYRASTSADSTNSISWPLPEDLLPAPHYLAFGAWKLMGLGRCFTSLPSHTSPERREKKKKK